MYIIRYFSKLKIGIKLVYLLGVFYKLPKSKVFKVHSKSQEV